MQMARQRYDGDAVGSLPSFHDVINTWDEVATSFMFDKQKLSNNQTYDKKERKFKLVQSSGIKEVQDSQGKPAGFLISQNASTSKKTSEINAENIFLLTNPFFTTSSDGNAFVMHLIGATHQGAVYHKTIGWEIELSNSPDKDGKIYNSTYDSIQILNPDQNFFSLKEDQSWTMAKGWNPNFINANLRVNKNMFDENSIVFAYPYSSSSNVKNPSTNVNYGKEYNGMPIFNVAQIWLDNNGKIKYSKETAMKDFINYDFGKQIVDYFQTNESNYGSNLELNNIYPYPSEGNFDDNNFNHNYNRLISVSPFDNTIIYATKPNLREDIFGTHNKFNKEKWAGFWIGKRWENPKNPKLYHPLIIGNDQSIVSTSDAFDQAGMEKMLKNINDLYYDGFTFDIASFYQSESNKYKLNLYFNQTGNGSNISYENNDESLKTSKIGLIRDVIYDSGSHQNGQLGSKGWGQNIVTKYPFEWNDVAKKLFATTINNDSFSSLIHSRADLEKWYPRTWANLNWPSNMLKKNEIFSYQAPWKFAVATEFNKQLKGQDWVFTNKESIDLVSAWKDNNENEQKYNKRFDRLIIKRPTIKAGSSALKNGLNLDVSYQLSMDIFNKIIRKPGWEINSDEARNNLTLTQNIAVQNTSVQILSAWGNSYKMKNITQNTSSIDKTNTYWNQEIAVNEELDAKNDPSLVFGQGNNNITKNNGTTVLRLMLKLVKPDGNLPNWFNKISSSGIFNKSYPVEAAFDGETTFQDIINKFSELKAKNLDLSDNNNSNTAVSFANLKIEASLELNPKFGSYDASDKFYNGINGNNNILRGSKILIDKSNNNQRFIYVDKVATTKKLFMIRA